MSIFSDFEKIRNQCLEKGEVWEDPDFPPTQTSVFYHQTPPFEFQWKRPQELTSTPLFLKNVTHFDIVTGKLGDRWLVSCLGCLWLCRELFFRVVPADQRLAGSGYAGIFRFRLWWCGEWREVLVDDRLPTVDGRLVFVHSTGFEEFWASLLEKAYAKLHGSYEALKYGSTLDGFSDLTGGITELIRMREDPTASGRILKRLLQMTSLVTVTVNQDGKNLKLANGIQIKTNYRVTGIHKLETYAGDPVQLVRLRVVGIWSEYIGAWSNSSLEWDEVPPTEIQRLGELNDGEFWMPYGDFLKTFTQMEVVHLDGETSREELSLRGKTAWDVRQYQGGWIRGVNSGGCRNNSETFHINPQLQLLLGEGEEIVLSLNQHAVMDPKVVGFSVYPLEKGSTTGLRKAIFKKMKSLANSQYTNSRQVSLRYSLDEGAFLLIPTTFEPGQEAAFTFRVLSTSTKLSLRLMDSIPALLKTPFVKGSSSAEIKTFSQYESVFLQLADEHRRISAFELQELLEASLPNDYIKSCATLDVARQFVIATDNSGLGKINFTQFKELMWSLKSWQGAFKNQTKEKTGVLKAERLRDTLREVGFEVNQDILTLLILRFMKKDGTLRFGDFVGAILHLTVAFQTFEKKDPLLTGWVKLGLPEWLKLSLMS